MKSFIHSIWSSQRTSFLLLLLFTTASHAHSMRYLYAFKSVSLESGTYYVTRTADSYEIPRTTVSIKVKTADRNLLLSATSVHGSPYVSQSVNNNENPRGKATVVLVPSSSICYVKQNGTGDGSSWENASGDLQAMINYVGVQQVWVAKGTYQPASNSSFVMKNDVALYGGFDNTDTANMDNRDWKTHVTILQGNGSSVISNKFTSAKRLLVSAKLDGFTVTGGNAENGGGLYNNYASPTLTNVIINNNAVVISGGGICNINYSSPILTNVKIGGNEAKSGGGIFNNTQSSPVLSNVLISGNKAIQATGGIYNVFSSSPILTNVTISGNLPSSTGGGIYNSVTSSPIIRNSIIWGNGGGIYNDSNSFPDVSYSIVQGLSTGTGNMNTDPLFVNSPSQSTAPFTGGDYQLQKKSPAKDAGNNSLFPDLNVDTKDLSDNSRVNHYTNRGVIDMGAYEFQGPLVRPDSNGIIYVKLAANGTGESWDDAIGDLQDAVDARGVKQVWVAKGTYQPSSNNSFVMKNDVAIYGGFDNINTSNINNRDWIAYETILKGNGNSVIKNDGSRSKQFLISAKLDGFTITGGKADYGGGIYNNFASPSLTNLKILNNSVTDSGGGIYNLEESSPILNNIFISDNTANYGGGIFNYHFSSPILNNVTIRDNYVTNSGGGMGNINSASPMMTNVMISGNKAAVSGAGIYNSNYSCPVLTYVTISGNSRTASNKSINGGGMYNTYQSSPILTNVLISGNTAAYGGAIYNGLNSSPVLTNVTISGNSVTSTGTALYNSGSSNPQVRNSVIWGNRTAVLTAIITNLSSSTPAISNSVVQVGHAGVGNLNTDPLFVSAPLHTTAPFLGGDYRLQSCSPAINSGTLITEGLNLPLLDLIGNPRIQLGRIDMGAYESNANIVTASVAMVNSTGKSIQQSNTTTYYVNSCNELITALTTDENSMTVIGEVTARIWIEAIQPVNFVKRHYEISPANNASIATGRITLYFTQSDFNAYNLVSENLLPQNATDDPGIANLRIEKKGGTSSNDFGLPGSYTGQTTEINPNDSDIVWNSNMSRWEVTFEVTGFSGFFVKAVNNIAMPVVLTNFTSKAQGKSILLDWQTTSEENASHFEVQRSANAARWVTLSSVQSMNESQVLKNYSHLDTAPLSSMNYYRLKMIDMDGSYAYSRIVSALGDREAGTLTATLYPNPSNGETTLDLSGFDGEVIISLYNMTGYLIKLPIIYQKKGKYIFNTRSLSPGIYYIHASNVQQKLVTKLVVK